MEATGEFTACSYEGCAAAATGTDAEGKPICVEHRPKSSAKKRKSKTTPVPQESTTSDANADTSKEAEAMRSAKTRTRKKAPQRKAPQRKKTTKKKTVVKHAVRNGTVVGLVVGILARAKVPADAAIVKEVKKRFPRSKFNEQHVRWYKSRYKVGALSGQKKGQHEIHQAGTTKAAKKTGGKKKTRKAG